MPICPKCNATIHPGAEQQCPLCGYSMLRADKMFGSNDVEFTRVVDEAGALTHRERTELLNTLANLERRVSPVVLCIYITDRGKLQDFRSQAHWVLNHARIHHPSFGRREQQRTIEEVAMSERKPGEARPMPDEEEPGWLTRNWQGFCGWVRDLCLPTPPPVKQEWMLTLVLDVQLEVACFSWGYMLDPYINPDRITSCIVGARLQFREREMVTALRLVMKAATAQLAQATRRVNKTLRAAATRRKSYALPWLLSCSLALAAAPSARAQQPDPPAENPAPAAAPANPAGGTPAAEQPQPEATPAPEPVVPGVPAAYNIEPRWSSVDYRHLMSGRLPECYNRLMPGGVQRAAEPAADKRSAAQRRRDSGENAESDTRVPGRYCQQYLDPHGTVLRDPQQLLTEVERADVMHLLRELNAHSRFHIYVSVFKNGQEIPCEVAAPNLVRQIAQPGQYTVLLQYAVGEPPSVDIGYKEIEPTPEQVRDWSDSVRSRVMTAGGGGQGLLDAVRCLHAMLEPVSAAFTPLNPDSATGVRKLDLPLKPKPKEKKVSWKDKAREWIEAGGANSYLAAGGVMAALLGLVWWFIYWNRSCGRLLESEPDNRLASRYGAGVSRYVKYLEGKEAEKEKKPF